jgi:hypothetical protein
MQEIFKKYMQERNGKWIVFCKDIGHMDELEGLCGEWFQEISENQNIIKISSENERTENDQAIRFLRTKGNESMIVALCVNMLNESFHDEEISGSIMARTTKSEILFRQQLGRVLSRDSKKIPIVFDLVNNIKYFQEFRKEITEIVKKGIASGKRDLYDESVLEQFQIYAEQIDFIEEFEEIEKNLDEYLKGETVVAKALRICKILSDNGVDFTNLKLSNMIDGKQIRTKLKDIEGIELEKILAENEDLTEDTEIGKLVGTLRLAYNGYGKIRTVPITEEEKRQAEAIPRINSRKKRNTGCKNIKSMQNIS